MELEELEPSKLIGSQYDVETAESWGHASLTMTMCYAHPAPDYLRDVISLGPIRDFRHPAQAAPNAA